MSGSQVVTDAEVALLQFARKGMWPPRVPPSKTIEQAYGELVEVIREARPKAPAPPVNVDMAETNRLLKQLVDGVKPEREAWERAMERSSDVQSESLQSSPSVGELVDRLKSSKTITEFRQAVHDTLEVQYLLSKELDAAARLALGFTKRGYIGWPTWAEVELDAAMDPPSDRESLPSDR